MLRELATKRIGFDKAAFVETSADLLPVLCQAWDAQWVVIEGLLPAVAAGDVPNGASESGLRAAEAMSLGTVCVKVGYFSFYSPSRAPLCSDCIAFIHMISIVLSFPRMHLLQAALFSSMIKSVLGSSPSDLRRKPEFRCQTTPSLLAAVRSCHSVEG